MEAGQICKSNIFVVFPDVQNLKHKNCISKVFFFFLILQAVIHGMVFAFIYLVLQKRQVLSEGKGEILLPGKISNLLLLFSVISFIVRLHVSV